MIILLIEDNHKLAQNVSTILQSEGYQVDVAQSVDQALTLSEERSYDLTILDLGLPDGDGIELCRTFRDCGYTWPILMLTARINIESKVEGLDSGADDYLTKPFLSEELLARVRALFRRESSQKSNVIQVGDITYDTSKKTLTKSGQHLDLSPIELKLLELLMVKRGQVLTSAELYDKVWGDTSGELLFSDTLKVTIARLRKKIGYDIITTVPGHGYGIR
jgi:DNA-binding response OmpR family regulator